jgi:hypothetical protein
MQEAPAEKNTLLAEPWDPLQAGTDEMEFVLAAQKREIRNILKSYTGYFDLFSEMIQNALDAVEKRAAEGDLSYKPAIWITIDLADESVSVTDNGCAMSPAQFKGFLKPNFSFKQGDSTRGSKGVGATYLAYGFNHLEIATRSGPDSTSSGVIEFGRAWLDDNANVISRPKVRTFEPSHAPFKQIERGTSFTLKLNGEGIRPKSLHYFGAKSAEQWMCLLRAHTPLGGIYLCGDLPHQIQISVRPAKAGMISGSKSHRGKSPSPVA